MLANHSPKKVLVIGSGPIIIGQAAEFDYSGSQCLQALRNEGVETILINSNPATIMTDKMMADKIYLEPVTAEFVEKIIQKERPDGLIGSFGGQTALNIAKHLAESGVLSRLGCYLLGSSLEAINIAEDRFLFREKMISLGVPVVHGEIVTNLEDGMAVAARLGFPCIIRPAYTLGGSGGGMAKSEKEFNAILSNGLHHSTTSQCLIEKSIAGFKEVEYEIIRDSKNNAISICNMENIDPVGVHTGDSVVVAPSQTLSDQDYYRLRKVSLDIVKALNIVGACNVQLAQDPKSDQFFVIEVNPRVSRSSALASKATGYPIAYISAQIALGMTLPEIENPITGTNACFEPSLDYVVTKIPRFPFDKFQTADRVLGSQMKATGEIMSLGRTLTESLLKGVRSLELGHDHLWSEELTKLRDEQILEKLESFTDDSLFIIAEALRRDITADEVSKISQVSFFFVDQIARIVELEEQIATTTLDKELLFLAKRMGFSDSALARLTRRSETELVSLRESMDIRPVVKAVDSCAAEFPAMTPYFYQSYEQHDEWTALEKESVVVIGSGPIRIGQGIEFDYSCVHALLAAKSMGFATIMINNNPETCSTDYTLSDRLYFEPLHHEDVLNILKRERPRGVIVQFGGQTALRLTEKIVAAGHKVLGTSLESIERAENRESFEALLEKLDMQRPLARTFKSRQDLLAAADSIPYPTIARPSHVLGGQAMRILHSAKEMAEYIEDYPQISSSSPLLIDQFIKGIEIEVDALSDGNKVFIPGIMEHVERAGVHSGDSMAIYPPASLHKDVQDKVVQWTITIAKELKVQGMINIQFTYKKGQLYILEVNPRASRTVPFLAKMTGLALAGWATKLALGKTFEELDLKEGLGPEPDFYSVKVPAFSFEKIALLEPGLGPEMKSTGEALGRDKELPLALYKGLLGVGMNLPETGKILFTISERYKVEALGLITRFDMLGFDILATPGTASFVEEKTSIKVKVISKLSATSCELIDLINTNQVDIIVNTLSTGRKSNSDGFLMRRAAYERKLPCFTSLDTAQAFLQVLEHRHIGVSSL